MSRTVYEVQCDFALSSGLRSEIIWDSLAADQSHILKQKIQTLIPDNAVKNENTLVKIRKNLFDNVWLQRKYTNRTLLSAIIYVMVTDERNPDAAIQSQTYSCHPVIRTRKCLNSNNSVGCCMIFIDEHSRIYKNWQQYLQNNILPKGTMIAPANGIYTFNDNDEIELEFHLTPVTRSKTQILNATDTVAGVGGLVAAVPIAAAGIISFPISASILVVSTTVAVATTAYSTLRSAMQLKDRRYHGQSTALTDREARNNWIGVAGGIAGLGSTGATTAMTNVATIGREITVATKAAVCGINVTSVLLSGGGIINGVYDLYMKRSEGDDVITGMDVLQLASSLLVFTHSINNLKIASKVTTSRRASTVLRSELYRQLRNIHNKIFSETTNSKGASTATTSQKFDIIRTVNDIPYKDVLMNLNQMYTHLNTITTGAITTAAAAGSTMNRPTFVSNLMQNYLDNNRAIAEITLTALAKELGNKFVQHIFNMNSMLDVLSAMSKYFCESVVHLFLRLAKTFIDNNLDVVGTVLNTFVSTETVLYKILMQCITEYSNYSYDYLESKTCEILNFIEQYFNSLNPININNITKQNCQFCSGYFYICKL